MNRQRMIITFYSMICMACMGIAFPSTVPSITAEDTIQTTNTAADKPAQGITVDNYREVDLLASIEHEENWLDLRHHREYPIAWSPDDQLIAVGYEEEIVIYDVKDMSVRRTMEIDRPIGESMGGVYQVLFSTDGKKLVSASELKKSDEWKVGRMIWDVETGEKLSESDLQCDRMAVSKKGNAFAFMEPEGIAIYDGETFSKKKVLENTQFEKGNCPASLSFSPDGKQLAAGLWNSTIQIWDVATGGSILDWTIDGTEDWVSLAWSPDQHYLASVTSHVIQLWNPPAREKII